MQVQQEGSNYKKKYKTLKRKLRMLIYEQECFAEELRRAQRKLLRISRDKSFLLDRLLQYEELDPSATDTDVTDSSASEDEHPPQTKRKKMMSTPSTSVSVIPQAVGFKPGASSPMFMQNSNIMSPADSTQPKRKIKVTKKAKAASSTQNMSPSQLMRPPSHKMSSPSKSPQQGRLPSQGMHTSPRMQHRVLAGGSGASHRVTRVAMTREELEQHLELTSTAKQQFMSLEKTPHILPDNIFNDNSNSCDFPDNKTTDDEDLVIDMP